MDTNTNPALDTTNTNSQAERIGMPKVEPESYGTASDSSQEVTASTTVSTTERSTSSVQTSYTAATSTSSQEVASDAIAAYVLPKNSINSSFQISLDEVYKEVKGLVLTKNPLDLIFRAGEIKAKFSRFILSIANSIVSGFAMENKAFIQELYDDSEYYRVWATCLHPFLEDAPYAMPVFAGNTATIKSVVQRYKYKQIDGSDEAAIRDLTKDVIDSYYARESLSEKIARSERYVNPKNSFDQVPLYHERMVAVGKALDGLADNFPAHKATYISAIEKLAQENELSPEETSDAFVYAFRRIIHTHYPRVRGIFYGTNLPINRSQKKALTKAEWLALKGKKEITGDKMDSTENKNLFLSVIALKQIILDLQTSMLSAILYPIILKLVASSISLARGEYEKFNYVMLFIFAETYENEYLPMVRFFNDLEVYINYQNNNRMWERVRIGFSLIVLFVLTLFVGYFTLPVLVFIPALVFALFYLRMYFIDDYDVFGRTSVNFGAQFYALLALGVFGYAWLTNLGAYQPYYSSLATQVLSTGSGVVAQVVPPEKLAASARQGMASIAALWSINRPQDTSLICAKE